MSKKFKTTTCVLLCTSVLAWPAAAQPDDLTTASPEGPQPAIINGDFENGLHGWTWDFDVQGQGLYEATGFAWIVPRVSDEPAQRIDHALQMTTWTGVEGTEGTRSEVTGDLHVEQRFVYTPGVLTVETDDFIEASALHMFGMEMAPGTSATIEVLMEVTDVTTGDRIATPIESFRIDVPCDHPVAIVGALPWRDYEVALDGVSAQFDDEIEVRFSVIVHAVDGGPNSFVHIATETTIDDVTLDRRFPAPPSALKDDDVERAFVLVLPAKHVGDGSVFNMLSRPLHPDTLNAGQLVYLGDEDSSPSAGGDCLPRFNRLER